MSTRATVNRRIPSYEETLFGRLEEDRGPKHDLPGRARPPSAPERPAIRIVEAEDRHHPGLAGDVRRIFDFHRDGPGGLIEARVSTYPSGPRCTCGEFARWRDCDHLAELFASGRLPATWREGGHG